MYYPNLVCYHHEPRRGIDIKTLPLHLILEFNNLPINKEQAAILRQYNLSASTDIFHDDKSLRNEQIAPGGHHSPGKSVNTSDQLVGDAHHDVCPMVTEPREVSNCPH